MPDAAVVVAVSDKSDSISVVAGEVVVGIVDVAMAVGVDLPGGRIIVASGVVGFAVVVGAWFVVTVVGAVPAGVWVVTPVSTLVVGAADMAS